MDGYIKNEREKIKKIRKNRFWTYVLVLIFVPLWVFVIADAYMLITDMPVDEWKEEKIVYSEITKEEWRSMGHRSATRRDVFLLNDINGNQYILPKDKNLIENLKSKLVKGEEYNITYSIRKNGTGWEKIEALSSDDNVFISLSESIQQREENIDFYIETIVWCMIGQIIALVFLPIGINKFFGFGTDSRKQIKEIKQKIKIREEKMMKKKQS